MKKIKPALIIFCLLLLANCATMTTTQHTFKSYSINSLQQTNIGAPMITVEDITYIEGKHWVGLFNSSDGWQHFKYATDDSFREELIYTGRSGDTIHVSYREYKKDFARPAFFQELIYDLGVSDTIVFRYYKIKVLEATNEFIRFLMLADFSLAPSGSRHMNP